VEYSTFEEAWAYQFGALDYGVAVYPSDAGRLAIRDNRDWQSRSHESAQQAEQPWVIFPVKWPSANVVFADVRDELLNGIRGTQEGVAERRVTLSLLEAATRKLIPEAPDLKKLTNDEVLAIQQILSTPTLASLMVNFDKARGPNARENAIRDITLRREFLEKPPEHFELLAGRLFDWILEDHAKMRRAKIWGVIQAFGYMISFPLLTLLFGLMIRWIMRGFSPA
jgi:hypothetical protein